MGGVDKAQGRRLMALTAQEVHSGDRVSYWSNEVELKHKETCYSKLPVTSLPSRNKMLGTQHQYWTLQYIPCISDFTWVSGNGYGEGR